MLGLSQQQVPMRTALLTAARLIDCLAYAMHDVMARRSISLMARRSCCNVGQVMMT